MISLQTALLVAFLFVQLPITQCRIHRLIVEDDTRRYIPLSKFGFYQGGELKVQLQNFRADPQDLNAIFGFSLDRTTESRQELYVEDDPQFCYLNKPDLSQYGIIIYFVMDLVHNEVKVICSPDWYTAQFSKGIEGSSASVGEQNENNEILCSTPSFPLSVQVDNNSMPSYNMSFGVKFANQAEQGFYSLYFHNCPQVREYVNFQIQINERNVDGFLSADEIPLPMLYGILALLFLLSGAFWLFVLRQSKHLVFKLHYLMAAVVFLKALSLTFQGVNYHFIQRLGVPLETWAVSYYITYLVSDTLLFVTLVLIATGWTFIKHVLSLRDNLVFMAIIPLQIVGNIMAIFLEESVEGTYKRATCVFTYRVVDFLSCAFILIPAFFSLCYLRQAKGIYGEPKLFRNFYIMLVGYIYFTRIVPYILQTTLSFQYGWLEQTLREIATYVFLVWTGCKFSPAVHHQYYSLLKDKEEEENEVITKSGTTEGIVRTTK